MSVKLENYLRDRREDLDTETPDDNAIWKGIEDRLGKNRHGKKSVNWIRIRNIAAAAFILFSLGYITNDIINGKKRNVMPTLSSIDRELGKKEEEYKQVIGFKTREVRQYEGTGNEAVDQLFLELKKLDSEYSAAMSDLKELGPDEKVINTIFNTYEQRIRLLELILLEINKNESHENNRKINL